MKDPNTPEPTPTPPGTPTQVFVRFIGEEQGGVRVEIGCDGEESATPKIRMVMSLVARAIAASFLVGGDVGAAERAERLAEYIAAWNRRAGEDAK